MTIVSSFSGMVRAKACLEWVQSEWWAQGKLRGNLMGRGSGYVNFTAKENTAG